MFAVRASDAMRPLLGHLARVLEDGDRPAPPDALAADRRLAEDLDAADLVAAVGELAREAGPAQAQPGARDDAVGVVLAHPDEVRYDDLRDGPLCGGRAARGGRARGLGRCGSPPPPGAKDGSD